MDTFIYFRHADKERERETDRDLRQRERERQTDRDLRQRERERQTDRDLRQRERDRETERETDRQRERERETDRQREGGCCYMYVGFGFALISLNKIVLSACAIS